MYLKKIPYVSNFEFVSKAEMKEDGAGRASARATVAWGKAKPVKLQGELTAFEDEIYRLRVKGPGWSINRSQSELTLPRKRKGPGATSLTMGSDLDLTLTDPKGRALLRSMPGMGFGVCGEASAFVFEYGRGRQFYGMGEKLLGLELSGVQTKFWNTDVFGDFYHEHFKTGRPDPLYASVPYLIVKQGNTYIGLLLDNPYPTFMDVGSSISIEDQQEATMDRDQALVLGSAQGQPNLWVLYGPTLDDLTRKFQTLVGRTPLPPVWALGYHQCRWGYASQKDLEYLDTKMEEHKIPCDGLWLDIEYMDGYRVFTFDKKMFPHLKKALEGWKKKGRRIVPIIDPGVKVEEGYGVYESGTKANAYCLNPQGKTFIGLVWPGETAFPDFSLPEVRGWWAKQVHRFASIGFAGAWLDMNDPSTGKVDCHDMLFDQGRVQHTAYHNQYALGMAKATREGFVTAHPDLRPFLLSRSAFTGAGKFTALWTGDNCSNYHYVANSIPTSINLALSGIPFNGPDIGGFGCDTWEALLVDWQKACFLFPFCRNHSCKGTDLQEPWRFSKKALRILRNYIQMRYRLRPYLYNCFVKQAETGEAILRPLFYDFKDTKAQPLGFIEDQFMVGPYIMQAPVVHEKQTRRSVVLPGSKTNGWYDVMKDGWTTGGRRVSTVVREGETPLYLREKAILPISRTPDGDHSWDPKAVDFHLVLRRTTKGIATTEYVFDDGETLGYQRGERSRLQVKASVKKGVLHVTVNHTETGFGTADLGLVLYDDFSSVNLTIDGQTRTVTPKASRFSFAGMQQTLWRVR